MRKLFLLALSFYCGTTFAQKVGINISNPGYSLDVYDSVNNGFPAFFTSKNSANCIMGMNGISNTSLIGYGMYRNGLGKAYSYINANNNYVVSVASTPIEHFVITPAGNVGIAQSTPGFPLNFANTLGDKISFYGTGGNHYGIGVQNHLLQIHSEDATSDIAFGTGSSASFVERMRIKGNGNVGIGTNNPSFQLDVYDTANSGFPVLISSRNSSSTILQLNGLSASSLVGIGYYRNGASKAFSYINSSNNYIINVGLLEQVAITPTGNVGIGQLNPAFPLNFANTFGNKISLYGNTLNTSYGFGVQNHLLEIFTDDTPSDIVFGYGNFVENMRITGSGSVGIGTSTPEQTLSVVNGVNIDQTGANIGTMTSALTFGSHSGEGIGSARFIGQNLKGLDFYTDSVNRMSITNTGKIGVGTKNPTSKLEIRAGGLGISSSSKLWEINYDSTNTYFYIDEFGSARRLVIKNGGNVGIGQTNPGFPLNFASTLGDKISLFGNSGNYYGFGIQNLLLQIHTDIAGSDIAFGYGNSSSFTENMRIKGNGKVGIGTTAPQQNLSIDDALNIDQSNSNAGTTVNALTFGSNSGEGLGSKRTTGGNQYGLDFYTNAINRLAITNTGNVGIGTTTPSAKLEVAGDVKTSGNIFCQNNMSVIRSNSSAPQKIITMAGFGNYTIAEGALFTATLTFTETFSAPPVVYVANVSGTGDMMKVMVTCTNVTTTNCTVNFYNPSASSITFNGTINFVAMGAQ